MPLALPNVLRPTAVPVQRRWAGTRLGGGTAELWLAGPGSVVETADGSATLEELAGRLGRDLVGARGMKRLGARFPLLVKLIDAGDWLSLQVHPSDAVARRRHGENAVGKGEAWLVLAADPGSLLITGVRDGLGEAELRSRIADGSLGRDHCQACEAAVGDAFDLPAGTVHAIGAGVLVYEIEQPSDLTYRISDWGRPPVPGRDLHPLEALEAVAPGQVARRCGSGWDLDGGALATPHFALEILGPGGVHERMPGGATPEVVSLVDGTATLAGDGWQAALRGNGALVVPARCPGYRIEAGPGTRVLVGSLPA